MVRSIVLSEQYHFPEEKPLESESWWIFPGMIEKGIVFFHAEGGPEASEKIVKLSQRFQLFRIPLPEKADSAGCGSCGNNPSCGEISDKRSCHTEQGHSPGSTGGKNEL